MEPDPPIQAIEAKIMILDEIKKIESSPKKLREFAFVVGGVLCAIGVLLLWRGRENYAWFLFAGMLLAGIGVVASALLMPLQKAWMTLAILIGWVMGRVLLSILFFLVLTPLGVILRLMGKDLLGLRRDPSKKSYWNIRSQDPQIPSDPERQY